MSTILPAVFAPLGQALAAPLQAGEAAAASLGTGRDAAMADLPATLSSVNQLQSLASSAGSSSSGASAALAAMPAPPLPAPQLQPPGSTDPLKQDYFVDAGAGDGASAV
jgi:hypothetical protein